MGYQLHAKLDNEYQIPLISKMLRDLSPNVRIVITNYDGKNYYMSFLFFDKKERQLLIHILLFMMRVKEVW